MTVVAVAVVVTVLAVTLRTQRPEQATLLVLAAGVALLAMVFDQVYPLLQTVKEFLDGSGLSSEYLTILIKGVGICLVTQLASDICRDAGEAAMANKTELAGRVALLMIGMPLFRKLMTSALTLIGE